MKNVFLFFLLGNFNCLLAQINDDFSDGDFTSNPAWFGDIDSFEVLNNTLHLNAPPSTSESCLVSNSLAAVNGYWEFSVQLDFNPSSTNKLLVYIMSDSANLKEALNGYYIQIGGANDQVNLYKRSGSNQTLLIEGLTDFIDLNQVDLKVKLIRDGQGNFELLADTSAGFTNYVSQGSALDFEHTSSAYFGLLCDYTSSRSDKFWLDDIIITAEEYIDQDAPKLLNYQLLSLDKLSLVFNEPLDSIVASTLTNFQISPNNIYSVSYANAQINIGLQQETQNNSPAILNIQVSDLLGNLLDTTIQIHVQDNYPFEQVLLSEIYPDESPSFGMPNGEFIEIYNPSLDTLLMLDWKIADAKDTVLIPLDTILPNQYIILCKSTVANSYTSFGKTITVPNFPSLNNASDKIQLLNAYNKVMDSVYYSNLWFREQLDSLGNEKKNGGYSLERIEAQAACSNYYNWYPSIATLGASPGQSNLVSNAVFLPLQVQILDVEIENDSTLLLTFNETLPNINITNCEISDVALEQVYMPNDKQLYVLLEDRIVVGKSYEIEISGIQDCFGSDVAPFSYTFHLYEPASPSDIVFNEVLFNPRTGGVDYIEFFNRSNKVIDLEGFTLVEYDVLAPDKVVDSIVINDFEILPQDYLVLTSDTSTIYYHYIVETPANLKQHDIPNLNDDESIIALYLPDGRIMDSLSYHRSWHLDLLDLDEGVALERISSEGLTNEPDNWHSAAKTYGYGTPTAQNSQNHALDLSGRVTVSPEVFTPNEDGYKDFCSIQYHSDGEGEFVNIGVYDVSGREVRLIAQNHSVGLQNLWKWNGLNNNFEKADVGIYIILFEVFSVEGKRKKYKEKVVLGTQLN